jgi:hypothetical protein
LIVETGHWLSGKQIFISPNQIDPISSKALKVFESDQEAILQASEYQGSSLAAA